MVEHLVADISFNLDGRSKKADSPEKTSDDQSKNDNDHWHADFINQEAYVKVINLTVNLDNSLFYSVYNHSVKLGDFKLEKVHKKQRQNSEQQPMEVFEIILIDMLSENQITNSFPNPKIKTYFISYITNINIFQVFY